MAKSAKRATGESLDLTDCGPIKHATIPFLPEGGVVIFGGRQGVGKSIALKAVEVAATGSGKVPIRDKAKAATIDGFGVNVRIGSRVTRGGDPNVVSVEGKLSISDLVDPGVQSPTAADARRIKALVSISGVEADIRRFVGRDDYAASGMGDVLSPETIEATDLVDMAERFKRDMEACARKQEDRAENARGRIAALKQATGDVDTTKTVRSVEVEQRALEEAIGKRAEMRRNASVAKEAVETAADLRRRLDAVRAAYTGPTAADARAAWEAVDRLRATQSEKVATLRAALDAEERKLLETTGVVGERARILEAATNHEATISEWEQSLANIKAVPAPSSVALDALDQVVEALQANVAAASLREKMKVHIDEIAAQGKALREAEAKAAEFRDEAKRVDEVLSDAVQSLGTKLRVEGGRLLTDTERGPTFFGELSDGQRWRIGLEIAIDQAASMADAAHTAIMVIPQAAWGELQPANRKWVAEECARQGVCAYTAIATDDEELTVAIG